MQHEQKIELLTRAEVATMLRLDIRTVRTLDIPVIKLGRQYRYTAAAVNAFIGSHMTPIDRHIARDSAILMADLIAFDAKHSTNEN